MWDAYRFVHDYFVTFSPLPGSFVFHHRSFYVVPPKVGITFFIRCVYVMGQKANLSLFLESRARL